MLGRDAPFVPGWDCHGLPIEWKVEEAYRKAKRSKDEVPPAEFRAECRAYAEKWVAVQRPQFERLGVLGDWDDPYLTMNFAAEAAILRELYRFADSGQVYRGAKPVMWSPVEQTALAEAEVEYEDVTSTQIDVAFEITESPVKELIGGHAVVWTTTPWTIPVNQAIAYGEDVEYVLWPIPVGEAAWFDGRTAMPTISVQYLLIAEPLLLQFLDRSGKGMARPPSAGLEWFGDPVQPFKWRGMGSELAGTVARHPMHHLGDFFARPRPFLPGDFVTTDAGTGLVHMSPDHGEDDFLLCGQYGFSPVFAGRGRRPLPRRLAVAGGAKGRSSTRSSTRPTARSAPICARPARWVAASQDYRHSYPHSWRSKAKLIFRATPQWFIAMDAPLDPLRYGEVAARSADGGVVGAGLSKNVPGDPSTAFGGPPPLSRGGSARPRSSPERGGGPCEAWWRGPPLRHAAPPSPHRHRHGPLAPRPFGQPHPLDGGKPPRLGDLPPARLGRADRLLPPPPHGRAAPGPGGE